MFCVNVEYGEPACQMYEAYNSRSFYISDPTPDNVRACVAHAMDDLICDRVIGPDSPIRVRVYEVKAPCAGYDRLSETGEFEAAFGRLMSPISAGVFHGVGFLEDERLRMATIKELTSLMRSMLEPMSDNPTIASFLQGDNDA